MIIRSTSSWGQVAFCCVKRQNSEYDYSYLEPTSRLHGAFTSSCTVYASNFAVIVSRESQRFLKYVSYCCYTRGGARLSPLGTPPTTGLIVSALDVDDDNEKQLVDWELAGKTDVPGGNLSLSPIQNRYNLTSARSRAAAVKSRWLITWAMARPFQSLCFIPQKFCIFRVCLLVCVIVWKRSHLPSYLLKSALCLTSVMKLNYVGFTKSCCRGRL